MVSGQFPLGQHCWSTRYVKTSDHWAPPFFMHYIFVYIWCVLSAIILFWLVFLRPSFFFYVIFDFLIKSAKKEKFVFKDRNKMTTWTSFVKIWTVNNCEFNANFLSFLGLYHLLFTLQTIGVSLIIIWWLNIWEKTILILAVNLNLGRSLSIDNWVPRSGMLL